VGGVHTIFTRCNAIGANAIFHAKVKPIVQQIVRFRSLFEIFGRRNLFFRPLQRMYAILPAYQDVCQCLYPEYNDGNFGFCRHLASLLFRWGGRYPVPWKLLIDYWGREFGMKNSSAAA
jgi:hypothetical protein